MPVRRMPGKQANPGGKVIELFSWRQTSEARTYDRHIPKPRIVNI